MVVCKCFLYVFRFKMISRAFFFFLEFRGGLEESIRDVCDREWKIAYFRRNRNVRVSGVGDCVILGSLVSVCDGSALDSVSSTAASGFGARSGGPAESATFGVTTDDNRNRGC